MTSRLRTQAIGLVPQAKRLVEGNLELARAVVEMAQNGNIPMLTQSDLIALTALILTIQNGNRKEVPEWFYQAFEGEPEFVL